jgi:hypothetical protein
MYLYNAGNLPDFRQPGKREAGMKAEKYHSKPVARNIWTIREEWDAFAKKR